MYIEKVAADSFYSSGEIVIVYTRDREKYLVIVNVSIKPRKYRGHVYSHL